MFLELKTAIEVPRAAEAEAPILPRRTVPLTSGGAPDHKGRQEDGDGEAGLHRCVDASDSASEANKQDRWLQVPR